MSTSRVFAALGDEALNRSSAVVGLDLLADITCAAPEPLDQDFLFVTETLEFSVFELLGKTDQGDELRMRSAQAFEHLRAMPSRAPAQLLRTACYGVIGDRTPDVARYLRSTSFEADDVDGMNWAARVRAMVIDVWLRLLRKDGWADLDKVLSNVVELRQAQAQADHEAQFLETSGPSMRTYAWELVASYHLAKAAEILATFSAQGEVGGTYDIREQLQAQFDRSVTACERAELIDLFSFVKLLAVTAERMVSNNIWTVTRAVNSRVTRFVRSLLERNRSRPIFEMLPPQRVTLRSMASLDRVTVPSWLVYRLRAEKRS